MSLMIIPDRAGRARLIVLVVILIAAAVPVIWIWMRPDSQPRASEGQAVAEAFLQQIREGRPEAAWESATADFKSDRGRDSFLRDVKSADYLKEPLDFVSVQTVSIHDAPRSEFLFRSTNGPTVRLVLNREAGSWKVDRWAHKN